MVVLITSPWLLLLLLLNGPPRTLVRIITIIVWLNAINGLLFLVFSILKGVRAHRTVVVARRVDVEVAA